MISLIKEDIDRLLVEEGEVVEEAHQISLPSNMYLLSIDIIPREDRKNCTIEVRAGAGGEEASLFTQDIWNMYKNYCFIKGWKWSELSVSHTASGG